MDVGRGEAEKRIIIGGRREKGSEEDENRGQKREAHKEDENSIEEKERFRI